MTNDPTSSDRVQVWWKRRLGRALAMVGFIALFVAGLVAYVTVHNRANFERAHRGVMISYQVEGTASAVRITYTDAVGESVEVKDVSLPWSTDVTVETSVLLASLWATSSVPGGTVTCRVLADGKKVAEQSSEGSFVSANCVGATGNTFAPHPATRPSDVTH